MYFLRERQPLTAQEQLSRFQGTRTGRRTNGWDTPSGARVTIVTLTASLLPGFSLIRQTRSPTRTVVDTKDRLRWPSAQGTRLKFARLITPSINLAELAVP